MSYDTSGFRATYNFSGVGNAAAAILGAIRAPLGCRFAAIEDIESGVVVALTNAAPGKIQIGTVATPAKYAAQNNAPGAGAPTPGTVYGSQDLDGRVALYNPALAPDATHRGRIDLMQDGDVAGTLQQLVVSTTAGTAGTYNAAVTVRFW